MMDLLRQNRTRRRERALRNRDVKLQRKLFVEQLEDRRLLAYTATLFGGSATLTGGAAADTLTIAVDGGGLLVHNRFTAGDAGFISNNDFVSGNATNDTILATAVTSLTLADGGNDTVVLASGGVGTLGLATGNLSVGTYASITQTGPVTVGGTTSLTSSGIIALTNVSNNFGGAVTASGTDVDLTDLNAIILGNTTASTLDVVAVAGPVTQTGAINVTGLSSFSAPGNDITLFGLANNFTGAVTLTGDDVDLKGNTVTLGAVSVTTLDVMSTGNVTQTAAFTITGASSFTAGGANVTLTNGGNNFGGAVSAVGNTVSLTDVGAIVLGTGSASTLNVLAGGAITQTGPLSVSSVSSFSAPTFDITLGNAGNDFIGAVSLSGANADVRDANAIKLGLSTVTTLDVIAGGAVTQSGAISSGAATFTATGFDITLTNGGNNFTSTVALVGADVDITDVNAIDLAASTVSSLDVIAGGAITDSGAIVSGPSSFTAAGFDITLTDVGNNFGSFGATGVNVDVNDISGLVLSSIAATTLDVTAGGAVTQTQALAISGATSVTATGFNITLTHPSNNFGGAVSTTGTNVNLKDANALILGASTVTTLGVVAGGNVTQAGAITATSTSSFTAPGFGVTLNSANDFTGAVSATANNVDLTDANSIIIGPVVATTLDVVASGGTITQAGLLMISGASSFTASANVTLTTATNNFTGAVSASGVNVDLTDTNSIVLGTISASTLDVISGVTISQAGPATISGASSFVANQDIALTNSGNNFTGAVSATGANIDVTDTNALVLGTIGATTLDVIAGDAVTQTGLLTITGASSVTTSPIADITLAGANDFTGAVSATGANVDITDINALVLGTVSATTLDVVASGAVTQAGSAVVSGVSSFNAGVANNVTLGNVANNFGGAITVTAANNATFADINAISFAAVTTTANFSVDAGGAVSLTGLVTAGGNILVDGASIDNTGVLDAAGGVSLTATGNVTVNATITADANSISGNAVKIDAGGNVSVNFAVTANAIAGLNIDIDPVDVTVSASVTATGDIGITASNNVLVNSGATLAADGNVDVSAGNNASVVAAAIITADANSNAAGVATIIADADNSNVGDVITTGGGLVSGAGVALSGRNVTIGAGGVSSDFNGVGVNAVKITATADVNINGPVTAVGALGLNIAVDPVNVTVSAALSATGNIGITASNNVTVNSAATITADSDANSTGSLTIKADDDNSTAGTLNSTLGGALSGFGVTLGGANVTTGVVTSTAGIAATASSALTFNAVTTAATTIDGSAATVTVAAGNLLAGGNVKLDGTTGVTVTGTIGSGTPIGGSVLINQTAGVLGAINVNGAVAAAGDIRVNGNTISTGGTLTAGMGVGLTGTSTITVGAVITAGANTVGVNAVKIDTAGDVLVNAAITATSAAGLNINIDPVNVTVSANISATGNIGITASNDISVGAFTIQADSAVSDGAGTLTITADDDGIGGGDLVAANGSVLMGADVDLAGDNVTVDVVTASTDDVDITAAATATLNDVVSAGTLAGDSVSVHAATVLVAAASNLLAGGNVELDGTASVTVNGTIGSGTSIGGNVLINQTAGVLGTIDINNSVAALGDIRINGNTIDNTSGTLTAGMGVGLTATSTITVGAAVSANANTIGGDAVKITTTGNVAVTAGATITAGPAAGLNIDIDPVNVTVGANISATGNIGITASNDISVGAFTIQADSGASDGAGTLTITADDDATGGGDLTAVNGSVLNGADVDLAGDNVIVDVVIGTTDDVDITGADGVTLNDNVTAGAGAGDSVTIDAVTGTLFQTAGNILAGEDVILNAGTAVNLDGTIGTTTAIGDDIAINTTRTGTVAIDGNVTANGAVSIGTAAGGAVTIGAAAATVITSDNNNSGAEDITILASGAITQSNAVSLLASNLGGIFITSSASSVTISGGADSNGVNQAGGPITTITGGAGAAIQISGTTDVTIVKVDASAGNVEVRSTSGDILLGDTTASAGISDANATFLEAAGAGGEVIDNSTGFNVAGGGSLAIQAHSGIGRFGGAGDALETAVATLAANNTTANDILIANTGGLVIGTVGSLLGIENTDAGMSPAGAIVITTASPLTISDDVIADGDITLTALDGVGVGVDNLNVSPADTATTGAVEIISNFGAINLNAGDNLTIPTGTMAFNQPVIRAGALNAVSDPLDDININVDNAAAGGDADAAAGSTVTIAAGTLFVNNPTPGAVAFFDFVNAANITSGGDYDTFSVAPQTGAPVLIDGGAPIVTTGDTLAIDYTTVFSPVTFLLGPTPARDGQYFFAGGQQPLGYKSIETSTRSTAYHLAMDLDVSGGVGADHVQMTNVGGTLTLGLGTVPAGPFTPEFTAPIASILSFQLYGARMGGAVAESLTISDAGSGGLPVLAGTLPATLINGNSAPNNPNVTGTPSIYFNGGLGLDALNYALSGGATSQTYGLGDGVGGGHGANVGTAEGEILTGASQVLYFAGLEPITTTGTPGGTLTVVGDLDNQLIQVVDSPVGGFTRVQAWNENRDVMPWAFSPYEFFDFAANSFTSLVVSGLAGDDIIDFISFDAAEAGAGLDAGTVSLLGGDNNDVISVITNTNGGVVLSITADGGLHDDEIVIGDFGADSRVGAQAARGAATVHSLAGIVTPTPITVAGGGGLSDSLRLDDSAAAAGHLYAFVAGPAVDRDGVPIAAYGTIEDLKVQSGAAAGADTFAIGSILAAPGVTRIQDAGGPADVISFATLAGGGGITWDMDATVVQSLSGVAATGPLLQVIGPIENFIGSPGVDRIFVDPLSAVGATRSVAGGGGEDVLTYDPLGQTATDAGSGTITFTGGLNSITYAGFTAGNVLASGVMPAQFVDNGNAGFAATAGFLPYTQQLQPLGGDIAASRRNVDFHHAGLQNIGDGTIDRATWTYTDIPNGWYSVMTTWTQAPGQAIDATYTVYDAAFVATGATAGSIIGGAVINQELDPDRFSEPPPAGLVAGSPSLVEWRPIDFVRVVNNTLTVLLTDAVTDRLNSPDLVLADAVRLELMPAQSILMDNGDVEFTPSAGGTNVGATDKGNFSDLHVISPGNGTATWTSAVLPAGTYLVSTSWVGYAAQSAAGLDTAAPFSVNAGPTIFVNQHSDPSDFDLGGVKWHELGVVTLGAAGPITVTLSDTGITLPVIADSILIQPIGAASVSTAAGAIADGGAFDFGPTRLGEVVYRTFSVTNTGLGHLNLSDLAVNGTIVGGFGITGGFAGTTGFSGTSLPPGATATFTVRFGPDLLDPNPNPDFPGDPWFIGPYAGSVSFTTDAFDPTYEFSLAGNVKQPKPIIIDNAPQTDDTDGNGTADGSVQPGAGFYFRDGFTRSTAQQGYGGDVAFAPGVGVATNTATWDYSPYPLAPGRYQVSATWSAGADRTTAAPYVVTTTPNGATPVSINQTVAPNDFASDGGVWEILGYFDVGLDGALKVTLGDMTTGFVIADAIRVQQVNIQVDNLLDEFSVVDDGDLDFACTAGCIARSLTGTRSSLNNDFRIIDTASGDSANWNFHVDPGVYVVGVSWEPGASNATNATYSINGGAGIVINQTLTARSNQNGFGVVVIDGKYFQILNAAFVVPALAKQINVSVGASALGTVIADAAFVMRITDPVVPLLSGLGVAAVPVTTTLDAATLDNAVAQAIGAFTAMGLNNAQLRALENLGVRLTPIQGNALGYASPSTGRVLIDNDGAGYGYGVGGFDLLSVVSHEIGHILGYPDLDAHDPASGLMAATLPLATLRQPSGLLASSSPAAFSSDAPRTRSAADSLFAQIGLFDRFDSSRWLDRNESLLSRPRGADKADEVVDAALVQGSLSDRACRLDTEFDAHLANKQHRSRLDELDELFAELVADEEVVEGDGA